MARRGAKAGDFYVEGHVDRDQIDADMRDVRQTVEKETKAAGDAAEQNIGGGFIRAGKQIESTTEGVRKFQGAISAVAGVYTGLLGTITLIGTSIAGIISLVDKWFNGQKKTADEIERARDLYRDIDNALSAQELRFAKITEAERDNAELLAKQQEELRKIDKLYEDGQITVEQFESLGERVLQLVRQEAAERKRMRAEEGEAYQNYLKGLEMMKAHAKELADEAERARKAWQESFQFISDSFAEDYGPNRQMFEEAGRKAGQAYASAFKTALSSGTFSQDIAGPIEEMTRRIEKGLADLKFGRRY